MIITQKLLLAQVKCFTHKEIKVLLSRDRLKFSYQDIAFYLFIIFKHNIEQKSFINLYQELELNISYSGFMKNINTFSILMDKIFVKFNQHFSIKASKLLNYIDTTLIPEKQDRYLTNKDWCLGRVTTRTGFEGKKYHIIGSKGLILLNRFNQIYHAQLLNINDSDQNILKTALAYPTRYPGILLADRGFSNKAVRERFKTTQNNIFTQTSPMGKLISPYKKICKEKLTPKERKLYKRRWKIELLFQQLKHNYSNNKLNLTGKYTKQLKKAKFFATIIVHNLTATR